MSRNYVYCENFDRAARYARQRWPDTTTDILTQSSALRGMGPAATIWTIAPVSDDATRYLEMLEASGTTVRRVSVGAGGVTDPDSPGRALLDNLRDSIDDHRLRLDHLEPKPAIVLTEDEWRELSTVLDMSVLQWAQHDYIPERLFDLPLIILGRNGVRPVRP